MSNSPNPALRQEQFLEVVDRFEATRRFQAALRLEPLGVEEVSLSAALGRVLAENVLAPVDVPAFDRASVDGFALQAADTQVVNETGVYRLRLHGEILTPGVVPQSVVVAGTATPIATGGMLPRGADAVVMIEQTDVEEAVDGNYLLVEQRVIAGQFIAFAGSDVARGETVLRLGQRLTSREIGVLAAIGRDRIGVYRRPRVAVLSTGNELVAAGEVLGAGKIYDSNSAILAAAIVELGGEAVAFGIVPDDEMRLEQVLRDALACDMVLLSGGTSKGAGDFSYRVVNRLATILVHGVALKPGKPLCLAVSPAGKPMVILPGFPTSAMVTFHEFIAPVLRHYVGLPPLAREMLNATLPVRVQSERGRTEYLLVNLMPTAEGLTAYPIPKNSGSVTAFSHADGFITIDQHTEMVEAGRTVAVQLIGQQTELADLVVIGSHCLVLDGLLNALQGQGFRIKTLYVGSLGGLAAAKRGECDLAGIHLMDGETGEYNRGFVTPDLVLIQGYARQQGFVHRLDDARFCGKSLAEAVEMALNTPDCLMINRNVGSGTRILIDRLLAGQQPEGYMQQVKTHHAVANSVVQGRADWGITLESIAASYGLGFIPLQAERYDFVIPQLRLSRPAVQAFLTLLNTYNDSGVSSVS